LSSWPTAQQLVVDAQLTPAIEPLVLGRDAVAHFEPFHWMIRLWVCVSNVPTSPTATQDEVDGQLTPSSPASL
jgi:hypothetical protein